MEGRLVEVDGHKMNVYEEGAGEHTLLIMAVPESYDTIDVRMARAKKVFKLAPAPATVKRSGAVSLIRSRRAWIMCRSRKSTRITNCMTSSMY